MLATAQRLRRSGPIAGIVAGGLFFGLLALPAPAAAAAPELLLQIPSGSTLPGEAAGQLGNPRGMAADPNTGHLYVAESQNARISEFSAWGAFVKAWGWDVSPEAAPGDTPSDGFEVCTVSCKAGAPGNGVGQINGPRGLAIDGDGDLYVYEGPLDGSSRRVQKFDSAGNFLRMFGGEVNKTTGANVCTKADLEAAEVCGAGVPGTADGSFSNGSVGNYVSYNPVVNTVFVGDDDRIQEFELDGTFKAEIDFEGALGAFDGKSVNALAADPTSGDLYIAFPDPPFAEEDPNAYRLDSETGVLLDVLEVKLPGQLAVDAAGTVYVSWDPPQIFVGGEVLGFDVTGSPIAGMEPEDRFAASPVEGASPAITGLATNVLGPGSEEPGDLYVDYHSSGSRAYVNAYGPAPIGFEPPPKAPPEIAAQYATSVGTHAATLRAEINPHFWLDTTYYLQYGVAPCSEGGCAEQPLPPGASLTAKSSNVPVKSAGVFLAGLQPDTTYHYRFVTQSGGSDGEEVIGVGGKPGEPGTEGVFTTFPLPQSPSTSCPNQPFRTGPGAGLPDCRAYELVSPLDKNNGDVHEPLFFQIEAFTQSAGSGERLTYSSATAFGDPDSAPYSSQYLAGRDPVTGWQNESISSPRTRKASGSGGVVDNEFKAFTADLCQAWLRTSYDPPLAAGAVAGFPNLYRRQNCGAPVYEALSTEAPPNVLDNEAFKLEVQGVSADGGHALYGANDSLPGTGAPPQPAACDAENLSACTLRLYEHVEGELRFVCVLPNEAAFSGSCYAGTLAGGLGNAYESSFEGAISSGGERIYWTASPSAQGPGRIYLRIGGAQTLAVSQTVAAANARFWGAAEDGSRAVFSFEDATSAQNGRLYRFDMAEKKSTLIAGGLVGVLGIDDDASSVYFASTEALGGEQENSEGAEAQAGKPNLYLYEEGAFTFVATLAADDHEAVAQLSPVASDPNERVARVSDDGSVAAFGSVASLTGYDNLDVKSGNPNLEVYLYDADEEELRCVSCNPSGARPTGQRLDALGGDDRFLWVAATLPEPKAPLYSPRALSADGERLFFESYDALVPRDTNGLKDVYQWEAAGNGDCDQGDASFVEQAGGCVDLISSGESPRESTFVDADESGEDVFFLTLSSLWPPDFGLVDVYDARVGGGFAYPVAAAECEGEACQSPPAPPDDPTPASSAFEGAGNVIERGTRARPRCRRGKVRRRGRCMPRSRRAGRKATNARRRVAR